MLRILGKAATAVTALSLAATPAIAQQSAASSLSLRAATQAENESELAGAPIVAIVALGAIITGAVILAIEDDDQPESP